MISLPKRDDEALVQYLANMKALGATVSIQTLQNSRGIVTREVAIEWETHNPDARVLA